MENKNSLKKFFLVALIVSLSVSALIGIIIFLLGKFGETEKRILATTVCIGASSLIGLCCATIFNRGNLKFLSIAGILASVAMLVVTLLMIWGNYTHDELTKTYATTLVLSVTCAQCSLLLLTNKAPLVRKTLAATLVCITIVAGMVLTILWTDFKNDLFARLLGVFAILDVLGTIVTPILSMTMKPKAA